jgi:uncharacterized protein with ParB-like and HNH nuclease domain
MTASKLQSLVEIFNEKMFRIPDFQRGYSWQEPQIEDFWDDIKALSNGRYHYTGQLTVEPTKKNIITKQDKWQDDSWLLESGVRSYYVIDGQQRLTTAIILINEILQLFNDDEGINFQKKEDWIKKFLYREFGEQYKSFIFGYEKDNPSDEYFKTKILGQKSSSFDKVPERTLYTANLLSAKKYFQKRLKKISRDDLEEIFKKVVNRFKFGFYEIDDDLDIFVTFETMNNRGKPLSNLELLKNRLIYLSTLLPLDIESYNPEKLRKDINETWKTIYEYLGKEKNNPLDDDVFLRDHWIMYFKYNRKEAGSYAKFLLNRYFSAKNLIYGSDKKVQIGFFEIQSYIDSLAEAVKIWFYIFNPSHSSFSEDVKEWLQKLNRLGFGAFVPLIMAIMIKEKDTNKILRLLKECERFIFLVFRLSQRQSNTQNNHFYRLANQYFKSSNSFDEVIEDIRWKTDGEDEDEYYGWFDLERFEKYMKEQYKKAEGYYSWNGIRYFLYEYELCLQEKANGNTKLSWTDFNKRKKEDTIEHIYPQNTNDKCWTDSFNTFKKRERNILLHSLGNLLLLAHSKNSELQNNCFDYKKKHKNKTGDYVGYFNGSYSEIHVAQNAEWTPEKILERGIELIDFLALRWQIDFDSWDVEKENLLKFDILE